MDENNLINNDAKANPEVIPSKAEEGDDKIEAKRICNILDNQVRRAEIGAVVKIVATAVLDPECVSKMKSKYLYGIIRCEEDICEVTSSRAYQIDWSIEHLYTGNSFLELVAPHFEHDLTVVKFQNEVDCNTDEEFTKQFGKSDGEWLIVEYRDVRCEFCGTHKCDRVHYRFELDGLFEEVSLLDKMNNEKRYSMYRRYTSLKHGPLGSKDRREIDDCVSSLIYRTFPIEVGKRKRGFIATNDRGKHGE